MRRSVILAAAAALILTGAAAGWVLHDRLRPPAPAAIAARDSTRADVAHTDSAEADRHTLDSLASARLARSETRVRASLQSAAASGRAADSLRQVLDTAQVAVDSLRRLAQATDELRRRQVDSLEAAVATRGSGLESRRVIWVALFAFAALWFAAVVPGPQVDDLRFREWHHAHVGVALALLGLAFGWPVLAWLGVAVLADDAVQHAAQRWWLGPTSRLSLFHWLYGLAYPRLAWLRALAHWLDKRIE